MLNSGIGPAALFAAVLAGGLAVRSAGATEWVTTLTGLTLLLVLFAYDEVRDRSVLQSAAFAAVAGFCLMLASSGVLNYALANREAPAPSTPAIPWLPLIWIAGTVLFLIVDRARTGSSAPPRPASSSYSGPTPVQTTAPIANADPPASATPQPRRPGKEVSIYVALVGEGMNILRPVQAVSLGHNYYQIVEEMPANETWEYKTGQVVRCEKKNLSSGKGLVAIDEAPHG